MKIQGMYFSSGILAFLSVHDRKRRRSLLMDILANKSTDGFEINFLDVSRGKQRGFSIRITGEFSKLNSVDWLEGFGQEVVTGELFINRKPYLLRAYPSSSHPGSAIIEGFGDLAITFIRHDCNPVPVAAIIAVSAAVIAVSIAVTAVAGDIEVKVDVNSDGNPELDVRTGDGGNGEGEESGGNGEGGEAGN